MPRASERFTGLFERTHRALLAYAVRRVTDPADAADVVADTFLIAWRRLDAIPVDAERAWLFGVARRVLANRNRGTRRRHAMADRLRQGLATIPHPEPSGAERPPLAEALDRLNTSDRELLRLLAWEELRHDEIAVALGISAGAVRVRVHRARRRLQAALVDLTPPGPAGETTTAGNLQAGRAR
ncbi:MAG: RNA polymerase sigma factor [Propionicimonas sp.]